MAESFQTGARVVDIARRHDLAAHELSAWRRQARQGLLALPAEAMEGLADSALPAFMPVSVETDAGTRPGARTGPKASSRSRSRRAGVAGSGDVSAERAAALVRTLRGAA